MPDTARVTVIVSGPTGSGKSAVMGEIEIALKALGVEVIHDADFQAEKNMTHADWQTALDLYKPVVILREVNEPRSAIPASDGSQRLSDHFTLAELTVSAAAARKGLDNTPPPEIVDQLILTADRMEKVRALLGGHPIRVTSGYRSPAVNKAVGGSATSAHRTGHAVDFTCPGFGTPAQVAAHLAKHLKGFDQIIEEFGQWVHVGFGPGQRGELLTARKVGGRTKYTQGIKGA